MAAPLLFGLPTAIAQESSAAAIAIVHTKTTSQILQGRSMVCRAVNVPPMQGNDDIRKLLRFIQPSNDHVKNRIVTNVCTYSTRGLVNEPFEQRESSDDSLLDSRQPSQPEVPMQRIGLAVVLSLLVPLSVEAQPARTVPRVGWLATFAASDPQADPVGSGLVKSLARPGGNVTGVTSLEADLIPKGAEFLHAVVPKAKLMAVLMSDNPTHPSQVKAIQDAIRGFGVMV